MVRQHLVDMCEAYEEGKGREQESSKVEGYYQSRAIGEEDAAIIKWFAQLDVSKLAIALLKRFGRSLQPKNVPLEGSKGRETLGTMPQVLASQVEADVILMRCGFTCRREPCMRTSRATRNLRYCSFDDND